MSDLSGFVLYEKSVFLIKLHSCHEKETWLFFLQSTDRNIFLLILGEIYTSESTGNDETGDGTQEKPFQTILRVSFTVITCHPMYEQHLQTLYHIRLRNINWQTWIVCDFHLLQSKHLMSQCNGWRLTCCDMDWNLIFNPPVAMTKTFLCITYLCMINVLNNIHIYAKH